MSALLRSCPERAAPRKRSGYKAHERQIPRKHTGTLQGFAGAAGALASCLPTAPGMLLIICDMGGPGSPLRRLGRAAMPVEEADGEHDPLMITTARPVLTPFFSPWWSLPPYFDARKSRGLGSNQARAPYPSGASIQ